MYFNNISENKKFLLFLSLSFILFPLLLSIVSYTNSSQYSTYALEEKNTLEDKKQTQNHNDNNTNIYNKTKEIDKLYGIAKEYYLSGDYQKAITYLERYLL